MKKKRAFLLLETLIALSLLCMLLSILFTLFMQTMRMEKTMQIQRRSILERQYLQIRIQDLFTSIQSQPFALYTQIFPKESVPSLIFCLDHGIDPNPLFSGSLIGRIYIDAEQNLCLALWPDNPDQSNYFRKEVLLSHVSDCSFEFFQESHPPRWISSWAKNQNSPSSIRLTLKQQEQTLQFAFILPSHNPLSIA